ncbi:unnamed protein product [Phytomonas sp. Hart1]|nr:unnamed protein product [Phytomonas sp. Hart1]|eukprot:CCW66244.1 unnamed protein product [Phytomonas sp. isolate Hart1]
MATVPFMKPNENASTPFKDNANNNSPTTSYAKIISSNDPPLVKLRELYHVSVGSLKSLFSRTRPWEEFFNRALFSFPASVSDIPNRISRNIPYFYSNYILLSLVCCSYILLINPLFTLWMLLIPLGFLYIRNLALHADSTGQVYLWNRAFTPIQLYTILSIVALLSFYFMNGMNIVFLILLISGGVTGLHAMFRQPVFDEPTFQLP